MRNKGRICGTLWYILQTKPLQSFMQESVPPQNLQWQARYSGFVIVQSMKRKCGPSQLLSIPASKQTQDDQMSLLLVYVDSDSDRQYR